MNATEIIKYYVIIAMITLVVCLNGENRPNRDSSQPNTNINNILYVLDN